MDNHTAKCLGQRQVNWRGGVARYSQTRNTFNQIAMNQAVDELAVEYADRVEIEHDVALARERVERCRDALSEAEMMLSDALIRKWGAQRVTRRSYRKS